ncbi:hypothetical protein LCGC14_0813630 [marine sediment metagenome]|uniref:Uncharacterized protein n=1 Tax=marine sediment metagenome TaxID=412755 RepID=A0A0F9S5U1_9ZZZZ
MAIDLHPDQTVPISLDEKIAEVRRRLADPDAGLKDLIQLARLLSRGNDPTLSLALHDHIGDQLPESVKRELGRAGQGKRLGDVLLALSGRMDYTAKGVADAIQDIIREHETIARHVSPRINLVQESVRWNAASFLGEVAVEALSRTLDEIPVSVDVGDGLFMPAKSQLMMMFAAQVRAAMIDQARANSEENEEVVEAVRSAMRGDREDGLPDLNPDPPIHRRMRYASSFESGPERPENPVEGTTWEDAEGVVRHYDGAEWVETTPAMRPMTTTEEMTAAFEAGQARREPKLIPSGRLPDVLADDTRWVDDDGDHWYWTTAGWRLDSARTEAARSRRDATIVGARLREALEGGEVDEVQVENVQFESRREVRLTKVGWETRTVSLDDYGSDEQHVKQIEDALAEMVEADDDN